MALFQSTAPNDWMATYAQRSECIQKVETKAIASIKNGKRKNKDELIANMKLVQLDGDLFNTLYATIQSREQHGYITLAELSMIMKWKLFRGQFRPRLQNLIDSNNNKDVIQCSKEAFQAIQAALSDDSICDTDQLKTSLNKLIKLKGVGVATASLILAIYSKTVPFMADEVNMHSIARAFFWFLFLYMFVG